MSNSSALKQFASEAKSRMTRGNSFPTFVGKVPYGKYELLLKIVGNNELLCRMCILIENESDVINPISYLIDKEEFNRLSPENQQRTVFRLATAYQYVRKLYSEIQEEIENTAVIGA